MANPQIENGFTRIPTELLEALCKTRINGEARQLFDFITRKTLGFNKNEDKISMSQLIVGTNLTRKSAERARDKLRIMNMITTTKTSRTGMLTYSIQKDYDFWKLPPKKMVVKKDGLPPNLTHPTPKKGDNLPPKTQNTIDNTKDTIQKKSEPSADLIKNPEFEELKEMVHALGFNIVALINRFKKEQKSMKATVVIPDEVYVNVCKSILLYWDDVEKPWPYFMRVLNEESRSWNANRNIEEHNKIKKQRLGRLKVIIR